MRHKFIKRRVDVYVNKVFISRRILENEEIV